MPSLWGRWHGEAVTEEVLPQYEFAEGYQQNGTLYRTSPAPLRGHPPQRGGLWLYHKLQFTMLRQEEAPDELLIEGLLISSGHFFRPEPGWSDQCGWS